MFCERCGKQLADGEVCSCVRGTYTTVNPVKPVAPVPPSGAGRSTYPTGSAPSAPRKGFFEIIKNRMGIGDEELNKGDMYEMGKKIIPDCVNSNEGEVPVKQYHVADLQNRFLGIPYAKAVGRMQVTNKRVIFRAPGRFLAGRTTLQHEFAIDELAGIEARREYVFNFGDFLIGVLASIIGGSCAIGILGSVMRESFAFYTFLALIFGAAGCVPFALLKKKWLLKLLCLSGSYFPLLSCAAILVNMNNVFGMFFGGFYGFLGLISLIAGIFSLIMHTTRPNLVLLVKAKACSDAVDIKRKKILGFLGKTEEEHTGYTEVLPAEDAERCIREINAMINDIQKLGDFGIEKWKA